MKNRIGCSVLQFLNGFIFSATLFLSASLLFIMQPMVAKILLPVYGGTPSVWTVCMLFFQLLLLFAYGYVWVLSRIKRVSAWRLIHGLIAVSALFVLPLSLVPKEEGPPELQIMLDLIVQLGLPLFVIAVSAPLLQMAFTRSSKAIDPYFLYAASNAGSLVALLSYPWFIERYSGVRLQFEVWNGMYLAFLGLIFCILVCVRYSTPTIGSKASTPISWKMKATWIYLSFVACSLMLSVTFYLSTDLSPTPILWVIPLALYLFSFVMTFAKKPMISHAWVVRHGFMGALLMMGCFVWGAHRLPVMVVMLLTSLGFLMLALLCHGELVKRRPAPEQLTAFYFAMSVGGVLAGIFNGIIAPRIFSAPIEYPLMMLLALTCVPKFSRLLWALCAVVLFLFPPWQYASETLTRVRNFYGVKQVFSQFGAHVLMSQNTLHGFQMIQDEHPTDGARAYYGAVNEVVHYLETTHPTLQAMVLGLGTGMMACQFRTQDALTLVEIDEQMIQIAKNPSLFTYLQDCRVPQTLIQEDGLLAVKRAKDASYDLLVMDAFNSDAIPVHLLTIEAFRAYLKKLKPGGLVIVNLTNRHVRMLPVVTGAGRKLNLIVLHKIQPENVKLGQFASEWAILTEDEQVASFLMGEMGWHFVTLGEVLVWTNDHSNIVPLLRFS